MKKILIIIIILIVCGGIFSINVFKNNNKIIKDDLGNTLAVMVSYDQGEIYDIYERKSWPTKEYRYKEAKCFDMNGKAVENAVTFNEETRKAKITTNQSVSCTLYFDYSLIDKLREDDPNGVLSKDEVGGMYRYQGVAKEEMVDETHKLVNNNYICFGTADKKECVNNEDKYMYRIIGVTNNSSLKLIKKEALDKGFQWYSDDITDVKWPQSYVYQAIIGDEYLNNENYISNDWKNKIVTKKWLYGDASGGTINVNGLELYEVETGQKNSSWFVIESDTYETGDLDANGDKIICSETTMGDVLGKKVCYTSQNKTTIDDIIIILGDAGINFCDKATDDSLKKTIITRTNYIFLHSR